MNAAFGLLDGNPVSEDAALPLSEHGVLLGDSAFETMRAYAGRAFMADAHIDRLARSAEWARIPLAASHDTLAREIDRVARAVGDAAVRVFVMRSGAGSRRLVFAEPIAIDPAIYERGISVCVLPHAEFGTPESAHAKYARYLPRLLARREAEARGAGDALLADERGRIVSAATGSVFAVVDGALVTSSILEGITRRVVLEHARDMRLDVALRPIEARDLERASEAFITSSLREIVPVVRIDSRTIGEGAPGETTRALRQAYSIAIASISTRAPLGSAET